ncbi:hypothetical protein Tdes44962_MAKER08224 [Teratosphaeria destructans]|uniref:Uncharacterized protein n=1 Tax=Teratosphaeria destructans TaxID=418781 RepID=A0A9W7SX96_9PEZI|nr:hypothetical protein Tdes44962_MAKER08224 [Teratosphaeria destructans]
MPSEILTRTPPAPPSPKPLTSSHTLTTTKVPDRNTVARLYKTPSHDFTTNSNAPVVSFAHALLPFPDNTCILDNGFGPGA